MIKPLKDQQGQRFILRVLETQKVGPNQIAMVINHPFKVNELNGYLQEAGPIALTEITDQNHQTDLLTFVRIQFTNDQLKQRRIDIIRNIESKQQLVEKNTQLLDTRVPRGQTFCQIYQLLTTYENLLWLRFWNIPTLTRDIHLDSFYLAFAKYENLLGAWIAKTNLTKEYRARLGKPRKLTDPLNTLRE